MGRSRMDLGAFRRTISVLGVLLFIRSVSGAHNETVDDPSPAIIYNGDWKQSTTVSDRIGGTTHYTKVQGSFATFSFGGASAIYLVGYGVTAANVDSGTVMDVELDGTINRVDQHRDEHGQTLMWGSGPIDAGKNHTVVVRKTSQDNSSLDVNVDAFILTVLDEGDIPPSPAPSIALSTDSGVSIANPAQTQTRTPIINSLVSNTLPSPNSGLPVPSVIWMPSDGVASSASQPSGVPNPVPSNSNAMSTAAIAGTTAGAVLLLCFIALGFYILGRWRRRAEIPTPEEPHSIGYLKTSIRRAGSSTAVPYNDLDSGTSAPLPIMFAARTGKGGRGRSTRISQMSTSDEQSRSGRPHSEFSDATSEPTWTTGPPAYEMLGSPGLPGIRLPHVRKE